MVCAEGEAWLGRKGGGWAVIAVLMYMLMLGMGAFGAGWVAEEDGLD